MLSGNVRADTSILDQGRASLRAAAMGSFTLGMLGGVRLRQRLSPEIERYAVYQRWMKFWCEGLLRIFGVEATIVASAGERPGDARRSGAAPAARLVIANHRSPLDIPLLLREFGGVALSRADLANWPVLGAAARSAETIFVDREDTMSGVVAARTIRDRLRNGRSVIVFPEGTTFAGDEVRPFHEGALAAARGLPIEIVPVGIAYQAGSEFVEPTFGAHLLRVAARRRTRVALAIGPARTMSGSRRELSTALRAEIQSLVELARRSVGDF
jgi:lyso-ornithine lipid O-acyltransferase